MLKHFLLLLLLTSLTTLSAQVITDLNCFTPAPLNPLSSLVNSTNADLRIEITDSGAYLIEMGKIEIDTTPGNAEGNFALYYAERNTLYLEVPKYNLTIELSFIVNDGVVDQVFMKMGQLDSLAPMLEVGTFGQK